MLLRCQLYKSFDINVLHAESQYFCKTHNRVINFAVAEAFFKCVFFPSTIYIDVRM